MKRRGQVRACIVIINTLVKCAILKYYFRVTVGQNETVGQNDIVGQNDTEWDRMTLNGTE